MRLAAVVFASTAAVAGVGAEAGLLLAGLAVGLADGLAVAVWACVPELAAIRTKAKSIRAAVPRKANGRRVDGKLVKIIRCRLRGASGITRNACAKGSLKLTWKSTV